LLPGLSSGYDPAGTNICVSGDPKCVDVVIKEMDRRFRPLARACDHGAIFSLAYLRTTEEYRRAMLTPGFFRDPSFVNFEDAVFAAYYFRAYDEWRSSLADSSRRSRVPRAWLVAFDAVRTREQPAAGDLYLGISAHINRDLAFVLDEIGLVRTDGSSRKDDHDKVNRFLERVTAPLIAEIERRFDDTVDSAKGTPGRIDRDALFQLIVAWREQAWRNAERLADAKSSLERRAVAQQIELSAEQTGVTLAATNRYNDDGTRLRRRTEYCAEHWND
jgi:Family of unknown function (DUF5995)